MQKMHVQTPSLNTFSSRFHRTFQMRASNAYLIRHCLTHSEPHLVVAFAADIFPPTILSLT